MQLHIRLWVTTMGVTGLLAALCALWWWRGAAVAPLVTILHRISGLLVLSAALLGATNSTGATTSVLHQVYCVVWAAVWGFQWRLLERYAPSGQAARYWTASSLVLLVLLQRIRQTGALP